MSQRWISAMLAVLLAAAVAAVAAFAGAGGGSARLDEIGTVTVGGMKVEAELEEAETMQMLMGGEWMLQRPAKGDTHHFEVALVDPKYGGRIPYARVSATFRPKAGGPLTKTLEPMYGKSLHYGANVALAAGSYDVIVRVQPPTLMREGEGLNRWLKPVSARFRFSVG